MIAATPAELIDLPDDALYEVVDGIVVEKTVSALANWVASRLSHSMGPHALSHQLGNVVGETIFILDPIEDLRRRPDLAFVSAGKWPIDRPPPATGDWSIIPDLAIEVASPGNTFSDLAGKVNEYFRHGVGEVWVLVPEERQVYIYRTVRNVRVLDATDILSTPLLPEWSAVVGNVLPAHTKPESTNGVE